MATTVSNWWHNTIEPGSELRIDDVNSMERMSRYYYRYINQMNALEEQRAEEEQQRRANEVLSTTLTTAQAGIVDNIYSYNPVFRALNTQDILSTPVPGWIDEPSKETKPKVSQLTIKSIHIET